MPLYSLASQSITTIKITSEFKNESMMVGMVNGLALHRKLLWPRLGAF